MVKRRMLALMKGFATLAATAAIVAVIGLPIGFAMRRAFADVRTVPATKELRDDFGDRGVGTVFARVMSDNFTAPAVTDAAQNMIWMPGEPIQMIGYRYEQAFAGTANLIEDGRLDLDVDDIALDGIAIWIGYPRSNGTILQDGFWDEDSGVTQYCEAAVRINDISEVNNLWFGYFLTASGNDVIDAGNWAGSNTHAVLAISDALGHLDAVTRLNAGAAGTDSTGITWADGQQKALRVTIGPDAVSFSVDGVPVTQTNAVLNWDDGDQAVCEFGYLNGTGDATPAPGISADYVAIGRK